MRRWLVGLLSFMLFLAETASAGEEVATDAAPKARPTLTVQLGHSRETDSVAFSPDGRYVLTAGARDYTAGLWEVATGRVVRRFRGHEGRVYTAAFSADASQVLTAASDGTARLWETATGKEVRRFEGHTSTVRAAVFTRDDTHVLTVSRDKTARLWERASGREVRRYETPEALGCVAVTPDGAHFVAGSYKVAWLVEIASGQRVRGFEGHAGWVRTIAVSPDGKRVLTGARDKSARLYDLETGRELRCLDDHPSQVTGVAFAPDAPQFLTSSWGTVQLWDMDTGRRLWTVDTMPTLSVAFSADGDRVLSGSFMITHIWARDTGRHIRSFEGRAKVVHEIFVHPQGDHVFCLEHPSAFREIDTTVRVLEIAGGREVRRISGGDESGNARLSPDGRVLTTVTRESTRLFRVDTGREIWRGRGYPSLLASAPGLLLTTGDDDDDDAAHLWDYGVPRKIAKFHGGRGQIRGGSISRDGKHVLVCWLQGTRVFEIATGREVQHFERRSEDLDHFSAAFAADGLHVYTGGDDDICMWDIATEKVVRTFPDSDGASFVTPSKDGTRLLTGRWNEAVLWDVATGRELQRFRGHLDSVWAAALMPGGSHVLTSSNDRTLRLWEVESGRELCAQVSFPDGSWVVFDRAGRYDASNGGDVEGVHWVAGMETIALSQLKERAYDPGLWAKHLGQSDEPLLEVSDFDEVALFPSVDVEPPAEGAPLRIALTNRGGGIGRVRVLVNGKEIASDARSAGIDEDAAKASFEIDLHNHPFVKPGEENTIEVVAWNAAGYLSSPRGLIVPFTAPGKVDEEPPSLWAIICGVSDYRGASLDLRFAAKDAEDFATALRLGATRLFGEEHVHIQVLSTSRAEGTTRPTRASLEAAFEAARAARPDDVLVLYLAGHGVSQGGRDGDFHYLLADAATADLTDPEVRTRVSLSSRELTELVKQVPAAKRQVLILDTCASGRLIEKLTEGRNVPGSQIRALDRVKDRTGMFVLAGCAADRVSYEASRYGQGLLTYSLLLGMRGGALREDEYVDVARLFGFASDQVPRLASDIGGVQRPVTASPRGGASFDIGRIPADLKPRIPLEAVKPVFVRTSFQDERRLRDHLKLGHATNAVLRNVTTRGGGGGMVFVDAPDMPEAYEMTGRYTVRGETITVAVKIWRGNKEIVAFELTGKPDQIAALAAQIVGEARKHVR